VRKKSFSRYPLSCSDARHHTAQRCRLLTAAATHTNFVARSPPPPPHAPTPLPSHSHHSGLKSRHRPPPPARPLPPPHRTRTSTLTAATNERHWLPCAYEPLPHLLGPPPVPSRPHAGEPTSPHPSTLFHPGPTPEPLRGESGVLFRPCTGAPPLR
jgi:hypothetical protein